MRSPHRRTRSRPPRSRGDLVDLDDLEPPVALDLLDQPGVAVRILERHERRVAAPLRVHPRGLAGLAEVEDLADPRPAAGEPVGASWTTRKPGAISLSIRSSKPAWSM